MPSPLDVPRHAGRWRYKPVRNAGWAFVPVRMDELDRERINDRMNRKSLHNRADQENDIDDQHRLSD